MSRRRERTPIRKKITQKKMNENGVKSLVSAIKVEENSSKERKNERIAVR